MKLFKIKNTFKFLTDLKFAILILALIAFASSLGSFIEQDEFSTFYQENYSEEKPIYGFITWKIILFLGLDHIFTTWWFLSLLVILAISLISCTFTRQFPLLIISKEYFFRKKSKSFGSLPFSVKFQNLYYLKELILVQIQSLNFYLYQTNNLIYGYKGLIGRISPILVHVSLIIILFGSGVGAFKNFKAQEILPKGELFHIQNPIKIGALTSIPTITTRVNDFWVEYENNRIHQFYSNLSILNSFGKEIKQQTISVNNPLRYQNVDFYQSDWNLLGLRLKNRETNKILEFPLFSLKSNNKSWITWVNRGNKDYTIILNNLDNTCILYDGKGNYIGVKNSGELLDEELIWIDTISATGLLIKYDPSIPIIYLGFALLMITTALSYLPYTQLWIFHQKNTSWIGGSTNRGKIQLEIEFENLIRYIENQLIKNNFRKK